MLSTPKSGEHDDQTAPIAAVDNVAMTASGTFATTPHTRSPGPTPALRSAACALRHLAAQIGKTQLAGAAVLGCGDDGWRRHLRDATGFR